METENLPSISTNTGKSRIPEHLQVFSLPAHSCQSSSSDTTETEFQHHLNLNNDDVSKKNQKNREETEKETDDSWNDAQSSGDSSLSDFPNKTSTSLSETSYESDGERMALNPTLNENYNVEDNRFHHGDFENAHKTNFEDSDDDQFVIDTEDFERRGCPDENGPYDLYLNDRLSIGITITRGEVLLMCLALATRHSFTWVAIIDLLKLINKLFNRRDVVPETKYKLLQHVPMEINSTKYHFYCRNCKTYLGEWTKVKTGNSIHCTCGSVVDESDSSFFLSLGFKSQIKRLLQNREVQRRLEYRFKRIKVNNNSFEDIYDGNMYNKLSEFDGPLSNQWNLSYTLNTDGCQAANSSKVTIWPIYAIINELPPKIRAKHTLLIGLWADKNEPDMKLFLPPFIQEANELSTDGVQWQLNEDTIITSFIIPSACCVDSIARADMLNMKRMNAIYGCTFCEHKTEVIDGYRRFTMSTTIFPERSDESMKENMIRAFDEDTDIYGIKGPSALMNLIFFDLVDGMIPDYMHSVLLGVIRQHTELLMSSPEEPYYAGAPSKISIINRRLSSITPPKCITRSPRSIDERRMWKASEWRSWLIWYAILCLRGLISIKYIEHLALLVSAINILLQSSITPVQLQTARTLLIKYVVDFQKYYGKKSMTYNVHLLLYLTKSVENWGPLWAINCFSFENENRLLLLMKKSPTRIMSQISQRFLFTRSLINFSDKLLISNNVTQFCQKLYENKVKFSSTVQNCVLIGSGKQYNLNEEETESLGYRVFNCKTYQKIIYNGKRYTSESYKRCTQTNDSVVETATGMVGIISNICRIKNDYNEERVILFIRDVQVDEAPYISTNHVKVSHIRRCYPGIGVLRSCTPASIIDQYIFINVDNKYYVSNIPRGCLGD